MSWKVDFYKRRERVYKKFERWVRVIWEKNVFADQEFLLRFLSSHLADIG
jgi:hypothetical protein